MLIFATVDSKGLKTFYKSSSLTALVKTRAKLATKSGSLAMSGIVKTSAPVRKKWSGAYRANNFRP